MASMKWTTAYCSASLKKFKGGPVGLTTIATAVGEEAGTIEEVYEPFLIQEGYLKRTPRGREATELAYSHLGMKNTPRPGSLFLGSAQLQFLKFRTDPFPFLISCFFI